MEYFIDRYASKAGKKITGINKRSLELLQSYAWPRPLAFTAEFAESEAKQTQWRAFLRRSGLDADGSLPELVKTLDEFLMPVVKGILNKRNILSLWRPGGPWKQSPPD